MTVYGFTTEGDTTKDPDALCGATWRAFTNCATREEATGMHAQRFIRERGGVRPGERLTFTLYTYTDKCPTHPNGQPAIVQSYVMHANRETLCPCTPLTA